MGEYAGEGSSFFFMICDLCGIGVCSQGVAMTSFFLHWG